MRCTRSDFLSAAVFMTAALFLDLSKKKSLRQWRSLVIRIRETVDAALRQIEEKNVLIG